VGSLSLRSIFDGYPFLFERHVEAGFDDFAAGELLAAGLEFAEVFAAESLLASDDAFAVEVFLADAGAVFGGGLEDFPAGRFLGVDLIEESPLLAGGTEDPEIAVGRGEDGSQRLEEFVFDEGGFVDDEDVRGEAAGCFGRLRQGGDAAAVGGNEFFALAFGFGGDVGDVVEQGRGLAKGRAGDEDAGSGRGPCELQRFPGDDGGFAPLAGAVKEELFGGGVEDLLLEGVGLELDFRTHFEFVDGLDL